jgi:hypothetical protein
MVLPAKAKLALLLCITAGCLSTFFTSPSITMWDANMRVLSPTSPQARQFCNVPRKKASDCEGPTNDPGQEKQDEEKKTCSSLLLDAQKCDTLVKRSYRNINLEQCTYHIKSLTLCEDEWCVGYSADEIKSCGEECSGLRESLTTCIQKNVLDSFRRNGLNEDGTII